jgi:hypothetical protein
LLFATSEEIYDAAELFDFFLKIGFLLKNGSDSPCFLCLERVAMEGRS